MSILTTAALAEALRLAEMHDDAKRALEALPTDNAILEHLDNNPLDIRIAINLPPPEHEVERLKAEHPSAPEEFIRQNASITLSCEIPREAWPETVGNLRVHLRSRVEHLAAELLQLGVDVNRAGVQ